MGERLLCKHQVIGSIPIGSTNAKLAIRFSEAKSDAGKRGRRLHADRRRGFAATQLTKISRDEDNSFAYCLTIRGWGICPRFDIVNGFLKSMPWHRFAFGQPKADRCY